MPGFDLSDAEIRKISGRVVRALGDQTADVSLTVVAMIVGYHLASIKQRHGADEYQDACDYFAKAVNSAMRAFREGKHLCSNCQKPASRSRSKSIPRSKMH